MKDIAAILWPVLVTLASFALSGAVTVHAVLYKRDTRAVIGWVGLAWLAPFLGPIAYFLLGINRIGRKAVSLRLREAWQRKHMVLLTHDEIVLLEHVEQRHPTLVGLSQLAGRLTNRPLLPGNCVTPLLDGDEAFPAMLEAIGGAERSIALSTYIFDDDRSGQQFQEALVTATKRGVEVRVLIDHVGSRYSRVNMVERLRRAGVNARAFLPTRGPRYAPYANLRNHRKTLVTDGRIGFTGGTNIREGHCLKLDPKSPVQCLHFKLEGPVVWHFQEAFAVDWAFTTSETLAGDCWFPRMARTGEVWARGIDDGPDEDFDKLELVMIGALAAAQKTVHIVTPYFLPEQALIHALNTTALRGVEVRIVLPSVNNLPFVHWASRALWWQLLQRGCRIHLSNPPFDHTKLFIVDGMWALLGSTNWDPRSLRLNFEFNVECYDPDLATSLRTRVEEKIRTSHEVTLKEVGSRKLPIRLQDGLARLLSPYL